MHLKYDTPCTSLVVCTVSYVLATPMYLHTGMAPCQTTLFHGFILEGGPCRVLSGCLQRRLRTGGASCIYDHRLQLYGAAGLHGEQPRRGA